MAPSGKSPLTFSSPPPSRYQIPARRADTLDEILFATPNVVAAHFRCAVSNPRFRDSGPARHFLVTFPRTAVWIKYAGSGTFVADPTISTIYNRGQEYTRAPLSNDGDRCDWLAVSPEVAVEIAESYDRTAADNPDRAFGRQKAYIDGDLYLAQRRFFSGLGRGGCDPLQTEEKIIWFVTEVLRRAYGANGMAKVAGPLMSSSNQA